MSHYKPLLSYQARHEVLMRVGPSYQKATLAQKRLLLDQFLEMTGYTRKYAIRLLNHPERSKKALRRRRLPQYPPPVQQAIFVAWKATHYVCARRLLPFLPALVALLQEQEHHQLTEEEHRQLLAMSVSTAQRFLRTQRKPCPHGLSTTTAGQWSKAQIPVCMFSQWEENRPGFVEMDLVAHCGQHLDGSFFYTLTLTDLATGWTECIPVLSKRACAVLDGLSQARKLFPFPLLGIDTDSGSEFLNEELIAYCEQEQVTFTRGRPYLKNDQCHVEQKNRAVVRQVVGYVRLEGVRAYHQLRQVYQALRLVVNCFQPSMKLQAKVEKGKRVRRVYDIAQTPLQRLLASGVLSQDRQYELSEWVQQIDPLALSEQLDVLRHALLCGTYMPPEVEACGWSEPTLCFNLLASPSVPLQVAEQGSERTDLQEAPSSNEECLIRSHTPPDPFARVREEILAFLQAHPEWTSAQILHEIRSQVFASVSSPSGERLVADTGSIRPPLQGSLDDCWLTERIQDGHKEPHPMEPYLPEEVVSAADLPSAQAQPLGPDMLGSADGEHEANQLAMTTLEQAIAAYMQDLRACGRDPKTLQWHQTSLTSLRRSLWRQFQLTDVRQLSSACLQTWVSELHTAPSTRTGMRRTVSTVAAYARSAHAFCNWLARQGYVNDQLFPKDAVPQARRGLPQPVAPEAFVRLLRACQIRGEPGGHNAGMAARNQVILWLLWDTGLRVCELCRLCLCDVDRISGTVTVYGKGGHPRIFPLSADGQQAVCAYLDEHRLTPAWECAVPEVEDRLLLTERRYPLTSNSLTLLFVRLSQRAGFTRTPICPSMLRDSYAIRFLQAGGSLRSLQEQLGLADLASIKRYQRFCDEQSRDQPRGEASSDESIFTQLSWLGKSTHRKGAKRKRSQMLFVRKEQFWDP